MILNFSVLLFIRTKSEIAFGLPAGRYGRLITELLNK